MPRYDFRWAIHHPLRWLRVWWVHLAVTTLLALLAITWTHEIYDRILQPNLWPIGMGGVAALILATALAPRQTPLLMVASAATITIGILRALALAEAAIQDPGITVLAVSFAIDSLLLASLGVIWPEWTVACADRATRESGAEGLERPCG